MVTPAASASVSSATEVEFWAAGGGIARCGPYTSELEAWEAMRYSKVWKSQVANKIQRGLHVSEADRAALHLDHPADTRVWPERKKPSRKKKS